MSCIAAPGTKRGLALIVFFALCPFMLADDLNPPASRAALEQTVRDYVALYRRETLEQWKTLFHPLLTVAHPRDDGSIRVRNLEEFYGAQKGYFETGRRVSERLENVRIEEGRRIARVTADFIFVDEGEESRGKLGLHLVESTEGWKIVAIVFSYDKP
ncbi:MAG TPA: nuclear transport factor 2 family protein [Terriglobales bacterium]|nr:nuclear transport factor 2 family protein [Terriglobales bacterium]